MIGGVVQNHPAAAPIRLVPAGSPQTVRKVLTRLKYSVPLYKAESGFSILTEEYLTFQTVSPNEAGRIYAYNEQQKMLSCSLLFHVFLWSRLWSTNSWNHWLSKCNLSVRWQVSTDKLFILNNLSGGRRGFPDKITFREITINMNSRGAHKKNAVRYEEWNDTELDWIEQPACRDLVYIIEYQEDTTNNQMQVM